MKRFLSTIESIFERLVEIALKVYGHPITFMVALACVVVFLGNPVFYHQNMHDMIRDIILCITFLSFFIIQKAFNKFTAALHLKTNELVSAHDKASNELVNIEEMTEVDLKKMARQYKTKRAGKTGNKKKNKE
jgi:low affinity Fe/Cu permease